MVPEEHVCSLEFGNGLDSVERTGQRRRLAVAREAEEKCLVLGDIPGQDTDVRMGWLQKENCQNFENQDGGRGKSGR
jgi:hypothetical protein